MKIGTDVPPSWADDADELSKFLEQARRNQHATFHRKKVAYHLLREIDGCFMTIGKAMDNPSGMDLLSPFLLMRCHSAFRAACGTAMAGQVYETFPLLRTALECAAYALFMNLTPNMKEVWHNRNVDAASKKLMRKDFAISKVAEAIVSKDEKLAEVFEVLYERCIDQGGHPNQLGVFGNAQITDIEDGKQFNQIYLHGDGTALDTGLKTAVEVGICCLYLLQNVATFTTRFELLGLKQRLQELRRNSDALVKRPL